ncbi:MAG: type II toxin-antitoxin system HicA family toxin [Pirellulales bacterium]|nr:type II toxin-antitoxin system HicA family toxin [Pirellulales bacterium]
MKRVDLIRHIESYGCRLLRDRGKHSVYLNSAIKRVTTVPRHREINDFLARKICRDLEVPEP